MISWSKNTESKSPVFKRDIWHDFIKSDNIIKNETRVWGIDSGISVESIFDKVLKSKFRPGPRVFSSGERSCRVL